MEEKGIMGVPIKLVMALVIGTMAMGVLMQFVGTAERTVLKDMRVTFSTSSNRLTVRVYDAASGDALGGTTVVAKYPGGTKAHTLGTNSNRYTFTIPLNGDDVAVVTVRVTRNGYIPCKITHLPDISRSWSHVPPPSGFNSSLRIISFNAMLRTFT